jgi:N-acetylglutamate synthase-like GNAT family acetyltransferase
MLLSFGMRMNYEHPMGERGRRVIADSPEGLFAEKRFYLDEFHEKTLLFALAPGARADDYRLITVIDELIHEDAHGIIVTTDVPGARGLTQRVRAPGGERGPSGPLEIDSSSKITSHEVLYEIWDRLREGPVAVLQLSEMSWPELSSAAVQLASSLRVHKLILLDPSGGLAQERQLSFLTEPVLAEVLSSESSGEAVNRRRPILETIHRALRGDVHSVNLCSLEGLARELFTYKGSGTLFTPEDYCRVERLGIDDFGEVERLLLRGQEEGLLKIRDREEIGEILLCGFGATLGGEHLAGVAALLEEPYVGERTAEIVGLYTISRFKGEGVGGKLMAQILSEARLRGLESVFACTTVARAGLFFEREGFVRVGPEAVPTRKWRDYETGRQAQVAVYRKVLSSQEETS